MRFFVGKKYYVKTPEQLAEQILKTYIVPTDPNINAAIIPLEDDIKEVTHEDEPHQEEWPEQHQGALEYSVFGWFKYLPIEDRPQNSVLFRLSNNEGDNRKD